MLPSPFARLLMQSLDVGLELIAIDAPHAAAPDLDGGKLAGSDEGIRLRDADGEICRYILILVMSAALVLAIWTIASERLVDIVSAALSSVCGALGC